MSSRCYVELKIAAVSLRARRVHPFVVLIRADAPQLEIARSETVWNERNPAFVRAFEVPLPVSLTEVKFRAVVYSQTSRSNELKKNACLGYGEFTLDRILSKPDGVIERVMKNEAGKSEPKRGRLVICGENIQCPIINHMFSIRFSLAAACNIYQPSRRRKTQKLFYVIYRAILNGVRDDDWTPVYRSEVVDAYDTREHNVMFEGACITAEHLYGMHENRALRFEIFQYSPAGSHSSLGFVQTSASAFKFAKPGGKLYMVPGPASKLKHAFVALETVKIGLSTRRGKVSSLFCLCADGFVWGEVEGGYEADDYLERDAFGRRRVDHVLEPVKIVRGVSYMGGRGLGESDQDDDESDALSINQLSMTEEE